MCVQESVIALPNSSTLVFPLSEGGFLVGLLVVSHEDMGTAETAEPAYRSSDMSSGNDNGDSSSTAANSQASAESSTSMTSDFSRGSDMLAAMSTCTSDTSSGSSDFSQAASGVGMQMALAGQSGKFSPAALMTNTSMTRGSSIGTTAQSSTAAFSEDELWCIRMTLPALAKACAMDLRSSLAGAHAAARQRLARNLLREARGPLTALRTFGSMLVPRLDEGEPDRDMAAGMLLQGQRLQEVVAQLNSALQRPSRTALKPAAANTLLPAGSNTGVLDAQKPKQTLPSAAASIHDQLRSNRFGDTSGAESSSASSMEYQRLSQHNN